jgi:RNA 3'-phosphate cyclase
LEGAKLNSRELSFIPEKVKGGPIEAEIGTAGSIPMLLMSVLPICAKAENTVHLHVSKGGTDVTHSPTVNYIRLVFLPTLKRMGFNTRLDVKKYGYYPKGMGEVTLTTEPCKIMQPIRLEDFGISTSVKGVSVCTFLTDRNVAERQANAAAEHLKGKVRTSVDIQVIDDYSNPLQKGSSIVLWCETDKGVMLGADAIGELRKSSEAVGREAAEKLAAEISVEPTVDVHLADMLVPYMAMADGKSSYLARTVSDHLEANIWLAEQMLNARFNVTRSNGLYRVEKVA